MTHGEIYCITNNINKKMYIGQAISFSTNGRKRGARQRWLDHCNRAKNHVDECRLLESAIRKYREENFTLEILLICNQDKLNYFESLFIKGFNTLSPNGYNLRIEGENGRLHSEETKNKMSLTRTGKKHSEETKNKIGLAHTNKFVSEETKIKIGSTSKQRNMNENKKQKLDERLKELNLDNLPMYIVNKIDDRYQNKFVDGLYTRKPGLKNKYFMSQKMSFKEKFNNAIQYLNSL